MQGLEFVQQEIKTIIATELNLQIDSLNNSSSFYELGLDSVNSLFLLAELEERLDMDIDPMSLYDNPTIQSFSEYLHKQSS